MDGDLGRSLLDAFATIPDPRIAKGRRHPLPAILALATAAMLSGARSLYAMAQWGRLQDPAVLAGLGFTREKTPAVSTLHLVFRRIDVAAFEAALQAWAQGNLRRSRSNDRHRRQGVTGHPWRGTPRGAVSRRLCR